MSDDSPTPSPVSAADYRAERKKRGTQAHVAALLGVHPVTLSKRERGAKDAPITREAWLALCALPAARAR
jgi:hypothetical protein